MNYVTAEKAPAENTGLIKIYARQDFDAMARAGLLAAECLDMIVPHVKPGVTTEALDKLCHDFIVDNNAYPSPLNYRGFPKSVCISINHVVCHGIPSARVLKDGDIMNIDVTVTLDGWFGDRLGLYRGFLHGFDSGYRRFFDFNLGCFKYGYGGLFFFHFFGFSRRLFGQLDPPSFPNLFPFGHALDVQAPTGESGSQTSVLTLFPYR